MSGNAHKRRVTKRLAGTWDKLTDHPKLALAAAFVIAAPTFSPRLAVMGTWICLVISWALLVAWLAGYLKPRHFAYTWCLIVAWSLISAGGLFAYGRYLSRVVDVTPSKLEFINEGDRYVVDITNLKDFDIFSISIFIKADTPKESSADFALDGAHGIRNQAVSGVEEPGLNSLAFWGQSCYDSSRRLTYWIIIDQLAPKEVRHIIITSTKPGVSLTARVVAFDTKPTPIRVTPNGSISRDVTATEALHCNNFFTFIP